MLLSSSADEGTRLPSGLAAIRFSSLWLEYLELGMSLCLLHDGASHGEAYG